MAIVAMTDPTASSNPDVPVSVLTFTKNWLYFLLLQTYPKWNDKSIVLSAFFWGYVIPQIMAGWLAGRYGTVKELTLLVK